MRSTAGNLTCTVCGHQVNPRSERCDVDHPLCSASGCRSKVGYWPLGPVVTAAQAREHAQRLLAAAPTRLVDLASYQEGISLPAVLAAGFTAVNIKLTQGNWYRWTAGKAYADSARNLGMGVCTFSWIDNSASGATQAAYAYQQMQAIGGPDGMAHQCDCEDSARPATFAIWRDYVNWWQDKLGRPIVNYTGDWWWQPRGWTGATVTPYLWAGPNSGYLASYPGDASGSWRAGYGGWTDYSLLQYAVQPITLAGGGNLSKTAIRDPRVWAALTGGNTDVTQEEHNALMEILNRQRWIDPRVEELVDLRGSYKDSAGEAHDAPIAALLKELVGRTSAAFTDAQAAAFAEKVGLVLVDRTDNPLDEDDMPAIVAAVKQALREGTARA